jgi:hypothetical protein
VLDGRSHVERLVRIRALRVRRGDLARRCHSTSRTTSPGSPSDCSTRRPTSTTSARPRDARVRPCCTTSASTCPAGATTAAVPRRERELRGFDPVEVAFLPHCPPSPAATRNPPRPVRPPARTGPVCVAAVLRWPTAWIRVVGAGLGSERLWVRTSWSFDFRPTATAPVGALGCPQTPRTVQVFAEVGARRADLAWQTPASPNVARGGRIRQSRPGLRPGRSDSKRRITWSLR